MNFAGQDPTQRQHHDSHRTGSAPDCRDVSTDPLTAAQVADLERQPFLEESPEKTTIPIPGEQAEAQYQRHSRPFGLPGTLGLLALLVVTIFTLSVIPFSITTSKHSDTAQAQHGNDENDQSNNLSPISSPQKDNVSSVPSLRDASEYTLNMAWNLDAGPSVRVYNWTINDAMLNPDGVYRPMILIDNQFPGPLVECNEGDTIVVHVNNQASNATSIHFHGLFQNGTNIMDGTVGVTQCPIAPDSTFTYRFNTSGQSGTYWYHAHHSAQASDGLLGPMVIHAKDEHTSRALQGLDYVTDRIVMVQDHYHNLTSELLMDYLKPDMENDEPVPDNALINGRGQRSCDDFPGWPCDSRDTSRPTFRLARNQRHRFRIINVGAFAEFQIQFDEHPFYVTEVDGTDVHPESFHRLNILPAQRYSIVLETNATDSSTNGFWMRARMVTHCFTSENPRLDPETRGVIRYTDSDSVEPAQGSAEEEPTSQNWDEAIEVICRDLNTTLLHPVHEGTPPPATDILPIYAAFQIGAWRLARGFFNESTWHGNTTSPLLHRLLSQNNTHTTRDDPDEAAVAAVDALSINNELFNPENELVVETSGSIRTVDIVINNFDDGAHPFHLHGHKFYVLTQQHDDYPPSREELPAYLEKHAQLLNNPLRRDTVTVEGFGWAILRVVLDNPGLWAFHCHNTWHAESGMVMQFLVRSDIVRQWELSEEQKKMCTLPGVERGQRPHDSLWFGL